MTAVEQKINPAYDEQSGYDTTDDRYPPDWEVRKPEILKRDDYICQDCGFQSGPYAVEGKGCTLDVHHITFLSAGGSNRPENLTTLCVECHNNRHDHDITVGRDYTPKPTARPSTGFGDRLRQLGRALVGGAVVLPIHGAALALLLTQTIGTPVWFAGAAYLLVLAVGVLRRPRKTAALYGCAGIVGLALMQIVPLSVSESAPVHPRLLVLSAFIPAVLALAWWWHQRYDSI
jgi:hypothetical protein